MTQQVGVEAGKETQNVLATAALDGGEQLDCGWEPWGEGLSQGRTRKSTEGPRELVQSCFWAAGRGQAGAETRCGWA